MPIPQNRPMAAALATLIILQVTMLTALYAGIPPHPPMSTPGFGMAPFIGASVAAAVAALILTPMTREGMILAAVAAVMAAVSFGPQKYLNEQFPLIWPAVIAGQIAIVTVAVQIIRARSAAPKHSLQAA